MMRGGKNQLLHPIEKAANKSLGLKKKASLPAYLRHSLILPPAMFKDALQTILPFQWEKLPAQNLTIQNTCVLF